MAPSKTTTLRVPGELRDEIARIAKQRGTTMVEVVADAVERLAREEWWNAVEHALDGLSQSEVAVSRAETRVLDRAAPDGLDGR
jgi:predicted transcriptional regulator